MQCNLEYLERILQKKITFRLEFQGARDIT